MTTFLAALAGGAIGVILAWSARLTAVAREIKANDRALRNIDDHLLTWVADDTIRLERALTAITNEMAQRNLFYSGEHGHQIALAKEAALQAYRDQERTSRSQAADIVAREGWRHSVVRALFYKNLVPGLWAPHIAWPVLDAWASPVTRHLSSPSDPPLEISDPRKRTLQTTIDYLAANPKALE